jgi:putative transposase
VFPETREQRCWVHQAAKVLNALPKSVQAGARRALNEIIGAEDRAHAERAIGALVADYGAKWPKAVAKVVDDTEALLTFFDYPAEHWLHLRTTNPIESTFSPVRARTRVTKGPGNKDAGLAMVFKLLEAAEGRWRAVNGPHLVALVRAGASFKRAGWSSDPRRRQRRRSTRSPRDHAEPAIHRI